MRESRHGRFTESPRPKRLKGLAEPTSPVRIVAYVARAGKRRPVALFSSELVDIIRLMRRGKTGDGVEGGAQKRLVVKLGTNLLTAGTDRLDLGVMAALVEQVARLHHRGLELLIVSSGR